MSETSDELTNNWWVIFLAVMLYVGVLIVIGFANQDYITGKCNS